MTEAGLDGRRTSAPVRHRLRSRIDRLRYITGFVTAFGDEFDPRVAVFARLWHVKRVVGTARRLAADAAVDVARVSRLAWMHDLNRWPFAHNSERGSFDQAMNVPDYFKALDASPCDISDLQGIHHKKLDGLTPDGTVVLFADALTGIVEDVLMAVTGLNVHPRMVPADIDGLMGFSLQREPWLSACRELVHNFHGSPRPDVTDFQRRFDALFRDLVDTFIARNRIRDMERDYPAVYDVARIVKETFTRPVIFPLNNERVCHSLWLREKVFPWYFHTMGGDRGRLLEMDERQFVGMITTMPGSPFSPHEFVPDLDVVQRELPHLAFLP